MFAFSFKPTRTHFNKQKKVNFPKNSPFFLSNKAVLSFMHEAAAEPVYLNSFQFIYKQEWKVNTSEKTITAN